MVPDRPVILYRVCRHVCVLNSYALRRLQISIDTKVPEGGQLECATLSDGQRVLTGVISEKAIELLVEPYMDVLDEDEEEKKEERRKEEEKQGKNNTKEKEKKEEAAGRGKSEEDREHTNGDDISASATQGDERRQKTKATATYLKHKRVSSYALSQSLLCYHLSSGFVLLFCFALVCCCLWISK